MHMASGLDMDVLKDVREGALEILRGADFDKVFDRSKTVVAHGYTQTPAHDWVVSKLKRQMEIRDDINLHIAHGLILADPSGEKAGGVHSHEKTDSAVAVLGRFYGAPNPVSAYLLDVPAVNFRHVKDESESLAAEAGGNFWAPVEAYQRISLAAGRGHGFRILGEEGEMTLVAVSLGLLGDFHPGVVEH